MNTPTLSKEASFEEVKALYHSYLGRLTAEAIAEQAAKGYYVGFAPTGYRNVRDGASVRLDPDPVLGPLVGEAFRLISERRSSIRQVLEELTPKGLVSRTGKPLGVSALAGILRNPIYAGMIRFKGELYRGNHEALVSRTLFERAGRSLRRRRK